jgi:hypothetical protein
MKGWNGSSNMTVDEGPSSATIARVDGKEKAYRVPETKIENGIDGMARQRKRAQRNRKRWNALNVIF